MMVMAAMMVMMMMMTMMMMMRMMMLVIYARLPRFWMDRSLLLVNPATSFERTPWRFIIPLFSSLPDQLYPWAVTPALVAIGGPPTIQTLSPLTLKPLTLCPVPTTCATDD
jgi:hypothetical protein